MGVDTKLFVEVQDHMSDRIDVVKRAIAAVKKKAMNHLDMEVARRGLEHRLQLLFLLYDNNKNDHAKWSIRFQSDTEDFGYFITQFGFNGESRLLHSFIDCDRDFEDYAGEGVGGVIFHLGCWGHSDQIMRTIIHELLNEYPMWYIENDAKDDIELYSTGET